MALGLALGVVRIPRATEVVIGAAAFLAATVALELVYHLALRTFDAGQLAMLPRVYYQEVLEHCLAETASFGLGLLAGSQAKRKGL